jgi:nucleoside triphosphate pyrophosphatase
MSEPLILASASAARARLLEDAGIVVVVEPAAIDEAVVKRACLAERKPAHDCALALAEAKAREVSARHPEALVIGADQILDADGVWFDKPAVAVAVRLQLTALRGRTHELATAACVVQNGRRLWHSISRPRLTMRRYSEAFLEEYLTKEGEAALGSVGGYRIEGRGMQLFARIEGDYFAILGLPLVELLTFLRERGAVRE